MGVKLLTEHNLECLSLIGGCTGSSILVKIKMPHCSKLHVAAQLQYMGLVARKIEFVACTVWSVPLLFA